jgi:hypothetical protein
MADNNNPQDFAEKVLQSLKKQSRAVDLTDKNVEENVAETVVEQANVQPLSLVEPVSQDFTAFGQPSGGGLGPASGGNKDLVVVPGYGGTAATSTSQINFYWNAPAVPDSTGVDTNVRATIFNYATSVTNPVLVIGGYNGTSQFKPHPGYGGGTGVTAKILIDPFLGRIDLDQIGLNTGVGVSTDAGILTYDSTQSRLRVGLSGIAKTVAFTDDIPVTSGFATTARNVDLASGANNASHFLAFSLTSTGSGVALSSDAELTYNPSTNILAATTFSGNLTGTATTAQNVNLAAGANAANHSVVFSLNATGSGVGLSSDAGLQYNPATNVLTADVFSGNFTGTAATATNFFGTLTGNVTGFATTAQNVNVGTSTSFIDDANFYLTFVKAVTGSGLALSTDIGLYYNPAYDILRSNNIQCTQISASGSISGTATTSQNVYVVSATTSASHPVLFTPALGTASGAAVSTESSFVYNPSTDILSVSGLAVTSATISSSPTTGSLIVTGGVGIGGSLNVGDRTVASVGTFDYKLASFGTSFNAYASVVIQNYHPGAANDTRYVLKNDLNNFAEMRFASSNAAFIYPQALQLINNYGDVRYVSGSGFSHTFVVSSGQQLAITSSNVTVVPALLTGSTITAADNIIIRSAKELRLNNSGNTFYTGFKAGANASNTTYTFPGAFPGSGTSVLQSDTSGTLTWVGIVGSATTSQNVNLAAGANNSNHSVVFSLNATGSGVALSSDAGLQYNPSTNVLTADVFSGNHTGTAFTATNFFGSLTGNVTGNLTGTATTAQNVNTVAAATAGAHYLLFSPVNGGSGVAVSSEATLQFNPATNVLTTDVFSGNLSGTAVTATNFFGALTGNVTGTATTAQNVNLAAGANNANHAVVFSLNSTGSGVALSSDAALFYNPSTDTLFSTNFSGAFSGTISGIASSARNVDLQEATANSSHYVTFSPLLSSPGSNAGVALSSDATLTYNPSTNVFSLGTGSLIANSVRVGTSANTVDTSSGNLTLDSAGGQVNINDNVIIQGNLTVQGTTLTVDSTVSTFVDPVVVLGSGVGGTHSTADNNQDRGLEFRYASGGTAITGFFGFQDSDFKFRFIPNATLAGTNVYSGNVGVVVATLEGNASGTAATYTNFFGTHVGNVTGNVTGTATTAQNVNTVSAATSSSHFLLFSPVNGASGVAVSSDAQLTYNPSTDVLSATTFSGALTGTATTAQNLNLAAGANNSNHSVVFSLNATGSGVALSSDAGLQYNPSTNVLTADVFSGNHTGTAFTATNFFGTLTGNVTGNLTGTATTATNINTTTATTAGAHYLLFSPVNATASGVAVSSDSTLQFNPGTNVLTTDVFSGNFTGTAATATNFFGTHVGNVTGNVTGTATTAQNVNTVSATTSASHFVLFSPVNGGSGVAVSSDVQLTYNPNTDVLSASTFSGAFSGNLTGTATTAQNVNLAAGANNSNHSVVFSLNATGTGVGLSSDAGLQYNPSTNVLTADVFSGNFTGTAVTATNFFGTFQGSSATAVTSQNINVVAATTAATHFITFSPASSGSGLATSADTDLTYNPSTNVLSAGVFSGNFTGTAATATNFFGTHVGNVTGTATTATNINTATAATAGAHYLLFSPVNATASGVAVSSDSTLQFNPGTNVLTTDVFSGNVSGTAVTATNLFGTFNGNLTGTATTAQNVNVVAATTAASHFITFSPASSGSGLATSADTDLTYNPSTNVLSAGVFSGNFTGTAVTATNFFGTFNGTAGSATTAQNVNVVAAASAGSHFLLLAPAASGSGLAVSSDAQLSYVPTTDTLTVSNIVGSGAGLTLSASAALTNNSYLTIQTVSGDDASTSDFFIRGITSGASSKFSVDANGNLRATTKSFDIEHPTKPGKRLVYGVLEGPEHGVYHRGTVEGKGNLLIELPDYWNKLVNEDYTVTLTTHGNYSAHIVEKSLNSFIIGLTGPAFLKMFKQIKVDYLVHGSRKDAPLIIEQDDH